MRAHDRRPATWLSLAIVIAMIVIAYRLMTPTNFPDFLVYRAGGQALLHHEALYSASFPIKTHTPWGLAFTYPPFSAALFAIFALMPANAGILLDYAVSSASFVLAAWLFDRYGGQERRLTPLRFAGCVAIGLVLEPLQKTFEMGQVNGLLIVLVVADLLVPFRRWPRGILLGVAAAIKLTPLVFLLVFPFRRDWRALFTTVATFLGIIAVGFAGSFGNSKQYWFHTVEDSGRIGSLVDSWNQSLNGTLLRMNLTGSTERRVWLVAVLAAVAVAAIALWRRRAETDLRQSFLIAAALELLISPVSWSHHWSWILLFLVWGVERATSRRAVSVSDFVVAVVVALFLVGPHWLVPYHNGVELHWTPVQRLIGEGYVIMGVLFLTASALGWGLQRTRRPSTIRDTGTAPSEPRLRHENAGVGRVEA